MPELPRIPLLNHFFKFAAVGLSANVLLYLAYLLLTSMGMGHKTAMSVLYLAGVCLTFVFNRNWTFAHRGAVGRSFVAYFSIYLLGYLVNFLALYLLVDQFGFNHRVVQGVMVVVIAIGLFFLQRTMVFKDHAVDLGPAEKANR